ncbi:MAG: hypothetical protein EP348_09940, partial [Alphaproteobacteria bacterium]
LSKDQQKLILDVAAEVPGQYVQLISGAMKKAAEKFLKEKGDIEVILSTDEEAAKWKAMMGPLMRKKYIESVSGVTKNGGEIYDQFVELVHKHEKDSKYTPALATYVKLRDSQ